MRVENKRHTNADQPLTSHSTTEVSIPPPPPLKHQLLILSCAAISPCGWKASHYRDRGEPLSSRPAFFQLHEALFAMRFMSL